MLSMAYTQFSYKVKSNIFLSGRTFKYECIMEQFEINVICSEKLSIFSFSSKQKKKIIPISSPYLFSYQLIFKHVSCSIKKKYNPF